MATQAGRRNRILRTIALLLMAVVLSTLILLFQFARESGQLKSWHILLFTISLTTCFYIAFLVFYAKKQRERTTRLSEEKYRSIIAVSGMGAWEFHADTGYLWCSPEYFEMLGYDQKSFLKQHTMTIDDVWKNMLHPDDRHSAVEKFENFFSKENASMYENTFRLKHKSGKWIWVLARSKALNKTDGSPGKVMLGTHIDITEKIAIQLALRSRNQKLMDFAFSNAHHVRGPVARILGLTELVKIDMEKDRQWYVETICDEVQKLDEIIKSIARELDEIEELPKD